MKMFRNFGRRWWDRKAKDTGTGVSPPLWIWIGLLCCLSSGCARRVTYVSSDRKLVRLEAGQAAPHAGVLMSEGYLAEIYEALGRRW